MSWIQAYVEANKDQVELIEALLLNAGALSITLVDNADEPILEPELGTTPIWQHTRLIGLFAQDTNKQQLQQNLSQDISSLFQQENQPKIRIVELEDKNWLNVWMDDYHPIKFGSRLWVCPSWSSPPDEKAINLKLDPGLAFGTGTHPTTSLCLRYLDKHIKGGEQVLDFGCGSGILGIAAVLLGAKNFCGIDIDPQAIQASKNNAKRNQLSDTSYTLYLPEAHQQQEYDWVIANILAAPLTQLAPKLAGYCKPKGRILLSGLLESQADDILTTYRQWFDLDTPEQDKEWILITGTKR